MKVQEAKANMLAGGIIAVLAAGFYWETYHFAEDSSLNSFGAAFIPRLVGALVFIFALTLFFQARRVWKNAPDEERAKLAAGKSSKGALTRAFLFIALMLLAASLYEYLGFMLTMPWLMFGLFCLAEKPEKRRYGLYLILSAVSPVIVFFVFYYCFSLLLPVGVLKPILTYL
ncbi:MAG: tripartite tricarboxylate transporter TctB family protein [Pyramidobacter sp.]|nr:tripartite tricarboxylate transporter TctB family protein [Pyramidobacter sp.]